MLLECKGKVMISGFPNELYDEDCYCNWNHYDFAIDPKGGGAAKKGRVIERLWCNF